jgi:beta-phosphoglucomutase-like phosphatase (HAD superfamily)
MIRAMIFDLDGTLVQTEKLKARSYAKAAVELRPRDVKETEVIEAFKDVVGSSRREVALALVGRFDLAEKAKEHMQAYGVSTPWQAFVQVRLEHYEHMLSDPEIIRANRWPHNLAALEEARRAGCKTALATMSRCQQANRVLQALDLLGEIDFVATRDDVEQGKPNPEIYQLVSRELGVPPGDCLVLEDSPAGVKAALSAGMWCIAVTTPFTRERVNDLGLLEQRWIVDEADRVPEVVRAMVDAQLGEDGGVSL